MGEELLNQGTEGIEGAGASTAEDQEGAQGNQEGQHSEPEVTIHSRFSVHSLGSS